MTGMAQGDRVPEFDAEWDCQPQLFRMHVPQDNTAWGQFRKTYPDVLCDDQVIAQLCELMGILDPPAKLNDEQRHERALAHLAEKGGEDSYGTWVYYPWHCKAVKVLSEEDFIRVRTNRNLYKITPKDQALLGTKKIGVIGMSVGKSIARVLTTERCCGEIRIADFDRLALSNMNRIQTSLVNMGMPKTTIVAREIAEQDPYIKVRVFHNGVTKHNMEQFLTEGGKLDVLLDECDSIDVKVACRVAARSHRIPVIMETNDRGMIDVERFDLEPNRPLFHGALSDDELVGVEGQREKVRFVNRVVGLSGASSPLKVSLLEIDQSTESWAQLSSEVVCGAGIATRYVKEVLLSRKVVSGKFSHDVAAIGGDQIQLEGDSFDLKSRSEIISVKRSLKGDANDLMRMFSAPNALSEEHIERIVEVLWMSPSAGNLKPWSIEWEKMSDERFKIVLALVPTETVNDRFGLVAAISFGCIVERATILLKALGLSFDTQDFGGYVVYNLVESGPTTRRLNVDDLYALINRETVRQVKNSEREGGEGIRELAHGWKGSVDFVYSKDLKEQIGRIVGESDLSRIVDVHGGGDLFGKELLLSPPGNTVQTFKGLYVDELADDELDSIAFRLFKDCVVREMVAEMDLGRGVIDNTAEIVVNSSAVGLLSVRAEHNRIGFVQSGRELMRFWHEASKVGVGLHPMCGPMYSYYNSNEKNGVLSNRLRSLLQFFGRSLDDDLLFPAFFRVVEL